MTWIPFEFIKQSHPIQVAEFIVARGIDEFPQFSLWVKHILKKHNEIIAATKIRIARRIYKYDVEVPTNLKHAYKIDRKNGNRLWYDTQGDSFGMMHKKIANVRIVFDMLEDDQLLLIGYTKASRKTMFKVCKDFNRPSA